MCIHVCIYMCLYASCRPLTFRVSEQFSLAAYSSAWHISGWEAAIIAGCLAALCAIICLIIIIIQHIRMKKRHSVSFVKPSQALSRFYLQNPKYEHYSMKVFLHFKKKFLYIIFFIRCQEIVLALFFRLKKKLLHYFIYLRIQMSRFFCNDFFFLHL